MNDSFNFVTDISQSDLLTFIGFRKIGSISNLMVLPLIKILGNE